MQDKWKRLMNWKVPPMPLVQKVILFLLFLCVLAPLCQNTPHTMSRFQKELRQFQKERAVQSETEIHHF